MTIKFATEQDRERWNQFVLAQATGSFLQSWEWGELQAKMGLKIWRVVQEENGQWQAAALVVRRSAPLGKNWLYAPHGPIGTWGSELEKKLIEIGEQEGAIFVRIDPPSSETSTDKSRLVEMGWRKSDREVQPKNTLVLDLAKSEEELLAGMHQKTRYNIRLAQKKGVSVRFSSDVRDMEHFLRLAREVQGRGKFSYHPEEYYREMSAVFGKNLEIGLAEYQGEVLAAHVIIYFGTVATYAHGASSSKLREVMAPHLLQWETIKRAKQKGYQAYDFFGVAPHSAEAPRGIDARHLWAGVTRFKLGFGGRRVDYVGAYDLVLSAGTYQLFSVARRLRGMLR